MGMDNEGKRLREIYAEQSDEDLLELHQEREDLTQVAQDALAQVMKDRGLAPQTAEIVQDVPISQSALLEDGFLLEDEIALWNFSDAIQTSQAIQHMTEAGIAFRMLDKSETSWNGLKSRNLVGLVMVVKMADASRAANLLHETMGLFPLPEGDGEHRSPLNPVEGLTFLAMFDLNEALIAAQVLGEAGISYLWRDGRDETAELPDEETVAIEVRQSKLEEATALIERRFAALSE
jgi:hypothetical protein